MTTEPTPLKPRARRRRRQRGEMISVNIIINGHAIDYSRVEYDDGTFEERGLPAGLRPRPSIDLLIKHAWTMGMPR